MSVLSKLKSAILVAITTTAMVMPSFASDAGAAKRARIEFPKGETRLVISDPVDLPEGARVVMDRLKCRYKESLRYDPLHIIKLRPSIIALANCPAGVFTFPILMIYRGGTASEEPRVLDLPQMTFLKRGFSSQGRQLGRIEWDRVPGMLTITYLSDMVPTVGLRHVYEYNNYDDFILTRIESGQDYGRGESDIVWTMYWEAPEWLPPPRR